MEIHVFFSLLHVRYAEDPTILGWDLGNELQNPGDDTGDALQHWLEEMSSYVKSLDPNHLVMAGQLLP